MKAIRLRAGKERSLLRRHPWVFEGSVDKGRADPGETVRVETADGRFLAWGAYSGSSMIRVRAWSFIETERIDRGFFERRIAAALDILFADVDAPHVITCLEITAGQGSCLGCTLSHLADIIDKVKQPKKLGVCLDTAHLFAAGYDFRGKKYDAFLAANPGRTPLYYDQSSWTPIPRGAA